MNGRRHFQPGPRCGNCLIFRRTERDKAGELIEEAHCASDLDPRTCGDAYKSKSKRHKTKVRKKKRWQAETKTAQ